MKKLRLALPALLGLLLLAAPVLAEEPSQHEKDKGFVALCFGCVTLIPFVYATVGFAFHLLLRAFAPRKTRLALFHADGGRARTFLLGAANTFVLLLLSAAAAHLGVHVLAALPLLALNGLALLGSHGLAASLGARITGSAAPELKELALGWFVLCYVGCFPLLGWAVASFWICRSVGVGVLSVLTGPDDVR